MLILRTTTPVSDATGLPLLTRDDLLATASGGVPWLVDMGFSGSYVGTTPAVNGGIVTNLVDGGSASGIVVPGTGPTIAGGGLSYAAANTAGTYVSIPASVAAAISAASHNFMFCGYFKLPTALNWITTATQLNPLMNWSATGVWSNQADILHLGLQTVATFPVLSWRRQTAIGTADGGLSFQMISGNAPHIGQVCQLSYWRDATGQYASIRSAAGGRTSAAPIAAGTNNSETISALIGKIGILPIWSTLDAQEILAKSDLRFYRGFVEIPATSGRTPLDVLDADWTRNMVTTVRFS